MPVSKEYLDNLDDIRNDAMYDGYDVEPLLEILKDEWEWLQRSWSKGGGSSSENLTTFRKWPTWMDKYFRFPNDKADVIDCLLSMSSAAYQLLYHFTNYIRFDVLIQEAKELHEKKNAGYVGDNADPWYNMRHCETFGIPIADGVLTRLCDKYIRFWNVYTNPANDKVNESVVDTLKDFAAYCLILVCILEE